MNKKERHIKLSPDKIRELAEKEKVSIQTVYAALRYETNSATAVKIRALALQPERGGVEYAPKENRFENAITL